MDSKRGGGLWGNGDGYQKIDTGTELKPSNYKDMANAIENNIRQMNLNVSKIDANTNLVGKPKDSKENRDEILSLIKNTGTIASQAATLLKDFSDSSTTSPADPERNKLKLRLRDDLERSLNRFRQSSSQAKDRLTSNQLPPANSTPSPSSFEGFGRRAQQPPKGSSSKGNNTNSDNTFNLGSAQPYSETEEDMEKNMKQARQRQQLVLLDDEMNLQDAIIAEREEGIKMIEKEMMEVRGIFEDLANIVEDQQILFSHLDDHITSSVSAVERAVVEQRTAAAYQKSGRNCTCIILLVCTGVVVAVVLFMVLGFTVFRDKLHL